MTFYVLLPAILLSPMKVTGVTLNSQSGKSISHTKWFNPLLLGHKAQMITRTPHRKSRELKNSGWKMEMSSFKSSPANFASTSPCWLCIPTFLRIYLTYLNLRESFWLKVAQWSISPILRKIWKIFYPSFTKASSEFFSLILVIQYCSWCWSCPCYLVISLNGRQKDTMIHQRLYQWSLQWSD